MNLTSIATTLFVSVAFNIAIGTFLLLPCDAQSTNRPGPAELDEAESPLPDKPPSQSNALPIHNSFPASSRSNDGTTKPPQASATTARFNAAPIRVTPTVTYGAPSWAPKRLANSLPGLPVSGSVPPGAVKPGGMTPGAVPPTTSVTPVAGNDEIELEKRVSNDKAVLNIHIVKHYHLPPTDTVMAYPWPVRPPKPSPPNKLQEKPEELKAMIIATGYSNRIDFRRPHPLYGWRWVHAFTIAHAKSGLGYPHTILTMYPWTSQITPYVVREVKRVNALEEARLIAWKKVSDEYDQSHLELENEAAAKGLFPVEIKVGQHGIGQTSLPPGNWWISATRKLPDLKFYWQVPVTVSSSQTVNVELTNVNAIVVQGGW